MKAERLQLNLILDISSEAQPLPPEVKADGVEIIAMMLVRLVRKDRVSDDGLEVRDESR